VKLLWLRWALLAIFVVNGRDDHELGPGFVALNVVAFLACALLLSRLGGPARVTLWAWTILFVFLVGYFIKFVVLLEVIDPPRGEVQARFPELVWVDLDTMVQAYFWATLAFVIFCVISWLLLGPIKRWAAGITLPPLRVRSTERVLLVLLIGFTLIVVSDALKVVLGIGVMGAEAQRLPLGLDTLIFRLRSDLLPAVLLLCIACLDGQRPRWYWLAGMTLLLIAAVASSVVSTSRGALLTSVLPVVFVWLVAQRFTRGRQWFFGIIMVLTVIAFPFISALRYIQITNPGTSDLSSNVSRALNITQGADQGELFNMAFSRLATRTGGMDGLLHVTRYDEYSDLQRSPGWLWYLLVTETLPIYHTREVVAITTPGDFRAPGFVGAFILMASPVGALLLTALFVVAMGLLWRWLWGLRTASVALALCAQYILGFASEGLMQWQQVVALAVAIWICEWLYTVMLVTPDTGTVSVAEPAEARGDVAGVLAPEHGV
jgi:hypothetical protein